MPDYPRVLRRRECDRFQPLTPGVHRHRGHPQPGQEDRSRYRVRSEQDASRSPSFRSHPCYRRGEARNAIEKLSRSMASARADAARSGKKSEQPCLKVGGICRHSASRAALSHLLLLVCGSGECRAANSQESRSTISMPPSRSAAPWGAGNFCQQSNARNARSAKNGGRQAESRNPP